MNKCHLKGLTPDEIAEFMAASKRCHEETLRVIDPKFVSEGKQVLN